MEMTMMMMLYDELMKVESELARLDRAAIAAETADASIWEYVLKLETQWVDTHDESVGNELDRAYVLHDRYIRRADIIEDKMNRLREKKEALSTLVKIYREEKEAEQW